MHLSVIGAYASERDRRIADFFKALTELIELCKPLIEAAVKEQQKEKKR
jgi:hypothetical protein